VKLRVKGSLGIVAAQVAGELDTAELPADLARRAEELFGEGGRGAARVAPQEDLRDPDEYEVTVLANGGRAARRFSLSRRDTEPAALEVARELVGVLVRRRAGGG
jgi:hypothetical protein